MIKRTKQLITVFFILGIFFGVVAGFAGGVYITVGYAVNIAFDFLEYKGIDIGINEEMVSNGVRAYQENIRSCIPSNLSNAIIHNNTGS